MCIRDRDRIVYAAGTGIIIQSSEAIHTATNTSINTTTDSRKAITLEGDITATRAVMGVTHITASGNISASGTITGNSLVGTLGTAAQTNITSVGTLSTLTVDDITINGSQISDGGNLTIISTGGDVIIGSDEKQIDLQDGDDNTKFSFKTDSTPEMDVTGNFKLDGTGTIELESTGDTTIDASGDIILDAAGKDISLTDGAGTAEFIFNLEDAPEIDVDGDFTIDGSGLIKLDSATERIEAVGNITASGDISASGNVIGLSLIHI